MPDSLQAQTQKMLAELFGNYTGPAFAIRLWDGWRWISRPNETPAFTVVIESPKALATLAAGPNELTLGEAFIHRDIDIEGDIFSVFSVGEYLINRPRTLVRRTADFLLRMAARSKRWLHHGARHSKARDRFSIQYHYDQPVAFFRPWLGSTLAYSCAYFRTASDPLDLAQEQKLEIICRKLRLEPMERFLDIGCGWGSLVLHAAGNHSALAHGITLSRIQADVALSRIDDARLGQRCKVELRDYRDCGHLAGTFDKIASVGMIEHVGFKNLPEYFRMVYGLLRPGGSLLNHGIVRSPNSPTREDSFIDRYVFPDGRLVTVSDVINAAESAGLEVRDVENLREHYELTLRSWVEGLQQNQETLRNFVPESTYRIWLLYMAGSAAAFRRGDIAIHQILFSRPENGRSGMPLVREDWYSTCGQAEGVEV